MSSSSVLTLARLVILVSVATCCLTLENEQSPTRALDALKSFATGDNTPNVAQVAAILHHLVHENSIYYDQEIGSLEVLVDAYNEYFDEATACSMEEQKELIKKMLDFNLTPLGPFIDNVREKQKHFCASTYGARLSALMDDTPADVVTTIKRLAVTSQLEPESHIFSVDNLPLSIVKETLKNYSGRFQKSKQAKRLGETCDQLINNHHAGEFLWLLKLIRRPSLSSAQKDFILGAKLCQSMIDPDPKTIRLEEASSGHRPRSSARSRSSVE